MTSKLLLTKRKIWVVVADESVATIYSQKSRTGPLTRIVSLTNDAARKKSAELISDRGGRSFDSFGKGRHTIGKEKSGQKKQAAGAFAKGIANRINKAMQHGTCDEFIVISAPRFLGVLRDAFAKAGHVAPARTIDKEMVGQDITVIQKLLADQ